MPRITNKAEQIEVYFLCPWGNLYGKMLLITDHKAFTRQVKPDDKAVISKMKCKLSRTISL